MSKALLKFVASVCVQRAWYWDATAATPDGYGGVTWPKNHPVLIPCRWDDVTELIRAANGEEVISNAQLLVTQNITVDSYLQLAPPDATTPPLDHSGARLVRLIQGTPLFRSADKWVRVVYVC